MFKGLSLKLIENQLHSQGFRKRVLGDVIKTEEELLEKIRYLTHQKFQTEWVRRKRKE